MCLHTRHVHVSVSACMSACMDLPVIQQVSRHAFQGFFFVVVCVFAYACACVCMHAGWFANDRARQPASSLTFHPAFTSPSLLYISFPSSILHWLCFRQGKCQCTHLGIGLADPTGPGYIHSLRLSQKASERERERENQSDWALDTCIWQVSQAWSTRVMKPSGS